MYKIKNLQKRQLIFFKNIFPEAKEVYIEDNSLIVNLKNGGGISVTYDREHGSYDSCLCDNINGIDYSDDIGKKTIYDAIKSQIFNDDDFIDRQVIDLADVCRTALI